MIYALPEGNQDIGKKLLILLVNEALNNFVGADSLVTRIRKTVYHVIDLVNLGTNYGERSFATNLKAEGLVKKFEMLWIYNHEAPAYFTADPKYTKPTVQKFLSCHNITLHEKASRSSSKKRNS